MDNKDREICTRIQEVMRERGLNQTSLEKETGVVRSTISAILSMKRSPLTLIEAMVKTYGLSRGWLMTGSGIKYQTGTDDVLFDFEVGDKLSNSDRVKLLNRLSDLYSQYQEMLNEAQKIMETIAEVNKKLILGQM